jgi:hypothetical protein
MTSPSPAPYVSPIAYSERVTSDAPVEDPIRLDPWERHLTEPVRGRKVIVAFEVLAGMTGLVQQLARWGSRPPLLIADGRGTGAIPPAEAAEVVMLEETRVDSLTDQVRARMAPDEQLTSVVRAAVERYDPDQAAVWWVSPIGLNEPMLGRQVLGGRPRNQADLEDKLRVDDLVGAVGWPATSSRIASTAYDDLMQATRAVVDETGVEQVVWVGDNRDGLNGGADYVRWVRSLEHARDAAEFFATRCDRVRVTAFLDGVPCSVHGMVLSDGVAVFSPMELIILREPGEGRFVYSGLGTTWQPEGVDAAAMRDLARRIGHHLQTAYGYRGAFGLDGVLTTDGFRVTELNARFSGGLSRLQRIAPDSHLELVQLNALIGRDVGRPAAELEAQAVAALDANRFVDVISVAPTRLPDGGSAEVPVRVGDSRIEAAGSDDAVVGTVFAGPHPMGSFFRFMALDGVVQVGDRGAPLSVLLHEFANRTWGAGITPALIAPDVRAASSTSAEKGEAADG